MDKRDIIITPSFTFDGRTLHIINSNINPLFLRQCLLFWDKIDWPDNNIISFGGESPETNFLIDSNILTRTNIIISSFKGNIGYILLIMQDSAFMLHNDREPGLWSLAQEGINLVLPKETSSEKRTIEVELYNCIPLPDMQVSLEDILNFKEKRKDELLTFRALMDDLYAEIINSKDIPRSKIVAIEKVQTSIADLHRVMKESSIKRRLSTLKVELNLSDLLEDILVSGVAAKMVFGIPPEIAAAIGILSSAVKVGFKILPLGNRIPENLKDYAYLYHLEKELI